MAIKKYEGLHGPKHHPYVGYGHKLLPGERFSPKRRNGKPMPCCALTSESSAPCSVTSAVTRYSWLHLPTMWGVEGDEKPDVCKDAKWQQKHLS